MKTLLVGRRVVVCRTVWNGDALILAWVWILDFLMVLGITKSTQKCHVNMHVLHPFGTTYLSCLPYRTTKTVLYRKNFTFPLFQFSFIFQYPFREWPLSLSPPKLCWHSCGLLMCEIGLPTRNPTFLSLHTLRTIN